MGRKILAAFLTFLAVGCAGKKGSKADEAILRYQVAQTLLAKGETTQGLSELIQAENLDPDNSDIQNLLALAYLQNQRPELAEEHLRKAVKLDSKFSDAQNHLCALLISKGSYDEAIEHCHAALENVIYATPERAYQNMGVAYEKKGDIPKAIESYQKALIHNKSFVLANKSLGNIFMNQRNYSKASGYLEEASKACKASPKGAWGNECSEVYYQLALAHVKLKNRTQAVSAFENCVEEGEAKFEEKCRENLKILR